jgi:hypothetical protein
MNVEYTFILDTHKKYKIPNLINIAGCECGKIAHVRRAKIKPIMGAIIKKCLFMRIGLFCSFVNNLMASANG